jgi:glycosidase
MLLHNRIVLFARFLLPVAFFLIFISSCKKEESTPDPLPPTPSDSADPVQYETPFAGVPNTSDIIMYEINERAFSSSGTFAGILPRLDSIKALGVNVIWLMPIHPIGVTKTVNSPYCVKNFTEVNPEYGTLNDLRTLVKEAHNRNMAVILDWVANHTSWDNPWIKNKAWYTQDGSGNIIIPAGTNWQDVADLNYDNSTLRKAMIRAMKYWVLTANVDGYRCDAADMVPYDFWKQAIDTLKKIPDRKIIMLAEGSRLDHFSAGFQLNFSWQFLTASTDVFASDVSATVFFQTHLDEYVGIPSGKHKLRFTSNHDICAWDNTPLALFGGKEASLAAFAITSLMGGVPLIYNGQEVGCPVKLPFFSRSPIDWTTNPDMVKDYQYLLGLKAEHPALRSGDLAYYPDENIVAFKRESLTDKVLVLVNTRTSSSDFVLPASLKGTEWKDSRTGAFLTLPEQISLVAFDYLILEK